MEYRTFTGFDAEGEDNLYVEIVDGNGEHIRYLDQSELEPVTVAVTEWLEKNKPLMDVCACGAPLDSYQECERGEECGELAEDEDDDIPEDDIDPRIDLNKPREVAVMEPFRLTDGTETFALYMIRRDEAGAASSGIDPLGMEYSRCDIGCAHEHAPAGAVVWHDADNTEELWEVK